MVALTKRRIPLPPSFVGKTMAELHALRTFFLTLDTELERIIEAEDLVTRATSSWIPSHEAVLAAEEAPEDSLPPEDWYEDQYWEELSAKFLPHFYSAVTLLVVAVLEAGLTRLCRFLEVKNKLPISLGQVKGSTLEQFRVFAMLNRWPLPSDDAWRWVTDLYQVRNALVHEAGSVYSLSERELENRAGKLKDIARRRRGLRVEPVFEEPISALAELELLAEVRGRGSRRKPPRVEAVTVIIEREFCATALDQTRSVLDELYAPLVIGAGRKSRSRSRRRQP